MRGDLRQTIATIVLLGTIVAAASIPGQAAAKHRKQVAEHEGRSRQVLAAQASAAGATHLRGLRYYGGPKSPMWRAPSGE